jgi:hypothetical protein
MRFRVLIIALVIAMFAMSCGKNASPTSPTPVTSTPVVTPVPVPPVQTFESGAVTSSGSIFFNNGRQWQYRGVTSFLLFQRYLNGENIGGHLDIYQQAGANTVRVFGMVGYSNFLPQSYGERYFSGLSAFVDEVAGHQMRVEFVIFADAQTIIPIVKDQQAHAQRVYDVLAGKWNVFVELANEADKNGIDPRNFTRPTVCASAGSMTGGNVNGTNWDYLTFHSTRANDWYQTFWVPAPGIPVVLDEPVGGAEVTVPGRRDSDPTHFYAFGKQVWTLNLGGATYHSDAGLNSDIPGPNETVCMTQLFKGMRGE